MSFLNNLYYFYRRVWYIPWKYIPRLAVCWLTTISCLIATVVVLALIPVYLPTKEVNVQDTGMFYIFLLIFFFRFTFFLAVGTFLIEYATNFTNGSSLTITDLDTLAKDVCRLTVRIHCLIVLSLYSS
jgi:hypothetical protein